MPDAQPAIEATAKVLAEKIRSRTARVGIIGLGYVGLPLAVEYAKAGFAVTGIDLSQEKTKRVNAGDSYVGDIPDSVCAPRGVRQAARDDDFSAVLELDTINICVPTPLRKTKDPDMSYHRVGRAGNCAAFPCGHAGDSGIHYVPGDHG